MGQGPGSFLRRYAFSGIVVAAISFPYLANSPAAKPQQAVAATATPAVSTDRAILASETLDLTGLQGRFEDIAKSVSPSVVAISASVSDTNSDDALRAEEMNGPKLDHILDRVVRTVGTGFVIAPDGYILTNEHVVGGCECLWVTTDSGKVYPAIVVGSDPRADLAVLKIPAKNLPAVKFAPYDSVRRGQWTIALGNPYGLAASGEMAMSVGVVSATDRSLPKLASKENRLYVNLIQTTAEINPGNSGGPLFDIAGEVIGVNTAVILPQKQTNGIGFAMPVNPRMMDVVRQLKDGQEVNYAFLGVTVVTPTERERRTAGLDREIGARVETVEATGPAADASMKPEDIVTEINGQLVRDGDHFVRLIGETPTTGPVLVKVRRNGKPLDLSVTLGKRPLPPIAVTRESQRLRWRGMLLGPVPAHWTDSKSKPADPGLMVLAVEEGSVAAKMGITQGSVIKTVAGQSVASIPDLQRLLNDTPSELCKFEVTGPLTPVVASTTSGPEH